MHTHTHTHTHKTQQVCIYSTFHAFIIDAHFIHYRFLRHRTIDGADNSSSSTFLSFEWCQILFRHLHFNTKYEPDHPPTLLQIYVRTSPHNCDCALGSPVSPQQKACTVCKYLHLNSFQAFVSLVIDSKVQYSDFLLSTCFQIRFLGV